ncbi:EamA-like transporter family protein [Geosporobacter subterraneus DSM 17957]|uniref:EamA-like transporter family protein n=1 Tax=Geosporobacter subterraneus DSM 17957 TaxID=1121919 RepID=A0A1M6M9K5_9FIRM|nr:EamA family transporter [Geosporobacter subterraneus]SHJ80155.1 EamA-like transporter family protein [Geosporobacter subterraneus DSM 17957]
MNSQYLPIVLVVLSSLCYHIFQKSTPATLNPIATLIVTYVCASVVSITSFFIFVPKANLIESLRAANWASLLLGFAVVGLELGFLLSYRMGWNISTAGLLSNTLVALLLIPIGLLLYKENFSFTGISGVLLCITGLILITQR